MLSEEIIKEIKHIELKAGHLATQVLAGEYLSIFRGLGQEFEKVREYHPGDDVRSIDWNVTARMNDPFVKVYREERELTLMLLVDVSLSQSFGTETRFKRELATELAAVLAFLATDLLPLRQSFFLPSSTRLENRHEGNTPLRVHLDCKL